MAYEDNAGNTWDKVQKEGLLDDHNTGALNEQLDDESSIELQESFADEHTGFRERLGEEPAVDPDMDYDTSKYESGDEAFLDRDSE